MARRENRGYANGEGDNSEERQAKVKCRRGRAAIRAGLCICAAAFVAGGVIAGKALIEDAHAGGIVTPCACSYE